MVGAVKVKCLRVRSEGWSPHKTNAALTELVRCRIANPRSGETLREFKSLRLRHTGHSHPAYREDTSGGGDISSKSQRGARPQCPSLKEFIFCFVVSVLSVGERPGFRLRAFFLFTSAGVCGIKKEETSGSWWFPWISFHRLEFCFFSSRSARRHGGRFYFTHWPE